jgi:hypothetical protein
MPKENNSGTSVLIERLEQAQEFLSDALALARKDGSKSISSNTSRRVKEKPAPKPLDFSLPIRAFIKRHARHLSGPKKFTLLVAYLAKGDLKKTISLVEIKKHWSRMTAKSLLAVEFNSFYSSPAKDNDWVNTEKTGLYYLRPSWRAIFDE